MTSSYVYKQAEEAGYIAVINEFGARFSTNICLYMLNEQMLKENVKVVMTNSGKFAHYGRIKTFNSRLQKNACLLPYRVKHSESYQMVAINFF